MPKYRLIATTPLRFHWLMRFVLLPIVLLTLFALLLGSAMNHISSGETNYHIIFLKYILPFAFYLLIFAGFFAWRQYAWVMMMISSVVIFSASTIAAIIAIRLAASRDIPAWFNDLPTVYNFYMVMAAAILLIIACTQVMIFFYYLNRKQLFFSPSAQESFPPPLTSGPQTLLIDQPEQEASAEAANPYGHKYFSYYSPLPLIPCPACGKQMSAGDGLCPTCQEQQEQNATAK
jgi:hypothetical protein